MGLAGVEVYPWERPDAPPHVKARQPVMEIKAPAGIRHDLPRRRAADQLSQNVGKQSLGIVIMTHRGSSNGRLSVCLSSIPENYPVVVSSDSVAEEDVRLDREVSEYHGAEFAHCTPWGGRARNAIHCMERTSWRMTLFLCDDVWLYPETCGDAFRWFYTFECHGVPLASLCVPGWETYHTHKSLGLDSWEQGLLEPWRFEAVPPNPNFQRCPALYKNPFGACFVLNRHAYNDLGGFATNYWAHDDVWNHKVWLSEKWVSAGYPGRGYIHLGAQSWHHGESQRYVGEFRDATGMTADESGKLQAEAIWRWKDRIGHIFESLGGEGAV